jgi:DNA-binding MarR family transcriptional regulator
MDSSARNCAALMIDVVPDVMQVIRHHMRSHRLPSMSVPQFRVLAFLDRRGSATLSDASEHVGTTMPSMSRMIQALVCQHMVRRQAGSPDRRTVRLEITDKGRQVLQVARQATARQLAGLIGSLSPDELCRLKLAMNTLKQIIAPKDLSSRKTS